MQCDVLDICSNTLLYAGLAKPNYMYVQKSNFTQTVLKVLHWDKQTAHAVRISALHYTH